LGGEKTQPKTSHFQENCQRTEKTPENPKKQETRKNSFVFAFNSKSFSFSSNSKMSPQTRQQNKGKKTPYKEASIEENNKKSAKKTKTQHNNNITETHPEDHAIVTRNVDQSQNASNNSGQNNNQVPLTNSQDETLEEIELKDADLDTNNWTNIQYNNKQRIFIPTEKTNTQNRH